MKNNIQKIRIIEMIKNLWERYPNARFEELIKVFIFNNEENLEYMSDDDVEQILIDELNRAICKKCEEIYNKEYLIELDIKGSNEYLCKDCVDGEL